MPLRIGINGFGRMGRLAARVALDRGLGEIVHVNEIKGDAALAAHLLSFDSIHGRWGRTAEGNGDALVIDGRRVGYSAHAEPGAAPWAEAGCDVVIEATGRFRSIETLTPYLDAGVPRVVVAAPVKQDPALDVVMGVNDHLFDPARHRIVTAASCTTNCLAPVVKVIHEGLGIVHGSMTTIHDPTNTQHVVDIADKDPRRARSALTNLIPTSTGSATAIGVIYPELAGKLNGWAVRVPVLNASITDCAFEVARDTTVEEVNGLLSAAAEHGPLAGILGFETRPLVSSDFVNDARSGIVDGPSTLVIDRRHVKLLAWYDNEWGYVNRMVELAAKVAEARA
jgi:glyceraldehyde 3-phosphate dehydrogenase